MDISIGLDASASRCQPDGCRLARFQGQDCQGFPVKIASQVADLRTGQATANARGAVAGLEWPASSTRRRGMGDIDSDKGDGQSSTFPLRPAPPPS
ncbi:MAG: hypothetical protein NHG36_06650 [Chromatiaceae bacterium]|nr:hypothetical protein [Candidatus Thioaporhodococcus sediminis]